MQVATSGPIRRYAAAMAYDRRHERVLLTGGHDWASTFYENLGSGTGHAWTQVATTGPSAGGNFAFAEDRGRMVVSRGKRT